MKKILLALILSISCIIVNAQPGHLDSTFGINGLVRTVVGMNYPASVGKDVLLHPDGSFYIFLSLGGFDGFCNIAHFMANGTLDLSYGEEGYSAHFPIIGSMKSRAVIQPDGKIIIGAYVNNNGNQDFLLVRLTTSGFLDSSFSNDGKQVTDINSTDNSVSALALQNDGKILALGGGMARYHPDGSLDSSFSGDGKLAGADGISIAIQSDGKILTAGGVSVFRYLADGTLDIGFGLGGSVSFSFISPVVIKAVAVQNDGKIVVGGMGGTPQTREDFLVARLNSNGSFDNSFSGDGVQTTNFEGNSSDYGEVLAIQNDGKILLAGRSNLAASDIALARYNTDGSLDDVGFSGNGILTSSIMEYDFASSIALQPDSKIMVAGFSINGAYLYYFVERFDANGNLDPSLDADGILIGFKPGSGTTSYKSSSVQSDGKIIAAGYTSSLVDFDFALARYNKDGSLDNSFSQDGKQTLKFPSGSGRINAIAVQTDGKIVVAGEVFNGTNIDFALARFNVDGTLDSSFSDDGILLTDFNGEDDVILSMALQSDGKIVVAGYAYSAGNRDFALARYNMDGALDNAFAGDGKLIVDLDAPINYAVSVLLQSDGKIVAIGNYNYFANSDLVVVRLNPDGSLDPLFDGDGISITDIGDGNRDGTFAAALQVDGKIVVAGNIFIPGHGTDFLIARFNTDGSFDNNFSDDGKLAFNLGSTNETANAIALQTDGKILVGGLFNVNTIDFGLIRLNHDGTPDFSFSDDAIATPDFGYGSDVIESLSISGNRVYAVGYTQYGNLYGGVAAFQLFDKITNPLTVIIPDAYALHDGVEANTVYIGYEPASKIRLTAEPSGGKAPYSFLWSNGATTASIKVSPIVNTNYSVTVTDASGNKITGNKMIKVVDVRCGNKSDKVLICQKEHGHSNRSVTICVSVYAVWAHLKDGSNLGRCQPSEETHYLTLFAYPNPTRSYFNLSIKSDETVAAELTIWNVLGKVVERKTVNTNSTVQIGTAYRPGLYFAEVKTKNNKERIKLLKLPD